MKFSRLTLACAITGALAACGGGSSNTAAVDPTTRTLTGVAAKGLIKNGIVKVYAYSTAGVKSAEPLVTSRTSSVDGSYSVSLGSNIGLFTVEVSADTATTMADEVSGTDIAMPVTMTMRSLVQLDSAAATSVKGYVTPFTDMLVTAASKATGGLTAANAATAQTGVITMLGFNPLTTKPVMANSATAASVTDPAEKLQSIHLAALSKIANDSSNTLGCSGTISEKVACVVSATSGAVELKDGNLSIPLAVQSAIHEAAEKVTADTSLNKTTLVTLVGVPAFTQATIPVGSTVVAPIPATKAMFASLRSNVSAWQAALKPGAVGNPVDTMKADFDKATAPLDQDLADWLQLSTHGVALYKAYADAGNTGITSEVVQNPRFFGRVVGSCTLYADSAAKVPVISGAANNVFCRLEKKPVLGTDALLTRLAATATAPTQTVDTTKTRQQFTKSIQLTPVTSSSFSYTARTRMETAYFNRSGGVISNLVIADAKTTIGDAGTGTVAFDLTGPTINNIHIAGDMPARTDADGVKITDKEIWNINYLRTPEVGSTTVKYALSGEIASYIGAVKSGAINLLDGSFIRAVPDAGGYVVANGVKEVNLALSVTGIDSKIVGTLALNNFSADKSGNDYAPTDLKFVGSLNNGSSEFFNGTLTAKVSNFADVDSSIATTDTNFLKGSASFVGILRIAGRPDLKLSLSGHPVTSNSGAFTGQYEDGTNTILISDNGAMPKVINIASANGVSVQFNESVNVADVLKNGSKIASFDRSTGVITYTDGSFESLK
ncbi:MAG: hypothetical protein Q7R66_13860 [Undibacterium sp.]|uniref:hypothetical protein n=1 Tax=Undibacterium sp. TaxID=1914977 RepID=UPI00271E868D|nr:hypothetical protein [Undibacterium sp.]MDO8653266.1 hypothetical protein [Undibacterium sp.]